MLTALIMMLPASSVRCTRPITVRLCATGLTPLQQLASTAQNVETLRKAEASDPKVLLAPAAHLSIPCSLSCRLVYSLLLCPPYPHGATVQTLPGSGSGWQSQVLQV